ncbi:MAG: Rpn family recombination-promoting nuclease/putative transposase [Chloroflexaceae bacterium]|nr:Rpn family recombination-promoting nuclease/putative transposase [Chloroflexaceae bacterium]
MPTRFIDPTTDYGFKRLFGRRNSPESKEILRHFLFEVLALPHPITDLVYLPTEQIPDSMGERTGIFDIYCTDATGQHFLVEMQRNRRSYFKERALYYATFPITQQVQRGDEGPPFKLLPIYVTSILSFRMDDEPDFLRRIQLANVATGQVFYQGLTFVFIELPKFTRALTELTTGTEKWLYLLSHMATLDVVPEELAVEPYTLAFRAAEEGALSREEWMFYQGSLKQLRDERSLYYTGLEEGRIEGLEAGIERGHRAGLTEGMEEGQVRKSREMARAMLADGMDRALVARYTGLSEAELEDL